MEPINDRPPEEIPSADRIRLAPLVLSELVLEDIEQEEFERDRTYRQRKFEDRRSRGDIETYVDEYVAPRGKGYIIISQAFIDDMRFFRQDNRGPETERTSDWIEDVTLRTLSA